MTTLVLTLENLLFPLGALGVALKFLFSPRRGALRSLMDELPERLGSPNVPPELKARRPVWLHCASAGEANAAAPLIRRLSLRGVPVIVTTTTAAGRERARELPGVNAAYMAPFDYWGAVSAFLDAATPRALIVVETELWPHMLHLAGEEGLPCALVNARMTERAHGRYRLFKRAVGPFLRRFFVIAAQTEEDARRYRDLGAGRVTVTGNMKLDLPPAPPLEGVDADDFAALGWDGAPVFTAASTRDGEEEAVVAAYLRARAKAPGLKLIVAPRHVERAADAAQELRKAGISFCLWSAPQAGRDAVLVDRLGVLRSLFAASSVAFVGGTLVPVGGHNVLEPALAGCPVLFGPHVETVAAAARLLESAGGGFCAADAERLGALLEELAADLPRAKEQGRLALKAARSLQGATERTWDALSPRLPVD